MDWKQIFIEAPWIIALGFLTQLFIKTILFRFTEKGYNKIYNIISDKHPPHDVYWSMVDLIGGFKNLIIISMVYVGTLWVFVFSLWMHFNH